MEQSFILNGIANGTVAQKLLAVNGDPRALRPFVGRDGRSRIDVNIAGKERTIVTNATATLRKEDWIHLDEMIVKVARARLRAVSDIVGAGLTYNMPNGMAHTVLQTERMGDINDASISMDGLRQGPDDRPEFDIQNLPLPIIHKDFQFSLRQILASRNGGSPLDTSMAELCGRKVAEQAEKLLLGTASSYAYGGGTIYGMTNFPSRVTRTITAPTDSAWTGATLLGEVLLMRQDLEDAYHYGPYMLYFASAWNAYLDNDYTTNYPITVRERIRKIEMISDVRTLDYLTGYDVVLVQMSSDVIREVIGMNVTTLQWDTVGGLMQNFKVMAILVPQLRADMNGNTGINHGSTS